MLLSLPMRLRLPLLFYELQKEVLLVQEQRAGLLLSLHLYILDAVLQVFDEYLTRYLRNRQISLER